MLNFERSSLSQKLSLMSLLSTGTALVLVFLAFAASTVLEHRREERAQLESLSAVIGDSTLAALRKRDWRQANINLEALKAMDGIAAAALYDQDGKPIARYGEADGEPLASTTLDDLAALSAAGASATWSTRMRWYRPVVDDAGTAGVVMLESSLAGMWKDIVRGLAILAAAMVGALAIAVPVANRFRGSVSEPVSQLIAAARTVAEGQNFGQRLAHDRRDELGTLIDSFNAMLAQIEERGNALSNHRNELERQVSVRTEQLEKAKNSAEAASRAKSAFLATMSHEIRTPMNGVLGMIEMLLATPLTEIQRNYASMVRRSGEHLLVIINDILDFSKIEAGKLTIEYINFNLHDLLDDIDSVYRPQAHAKGVSLFLDLDPALPLAICGDPNRLRQVLANLLGNAIKFTDSGEIRIRARITGEDEQACGMRFEVHDTGIGISREARSRIFEAFSQADNSTTRKYGGTGLGLAISKQLVELMGGRIGVENAVTQGSVFWFEATFDKRRVALERSDSAAHARLRELRVLLLDERADTRDLLAQRLATLGLRADLAGTSLDAQDALIAAAREARPYDAAFIDLDLRGTSGLALCAELKANPLLASLRVILLSAARTAADPVQRREAGAACQLVHPARPGDLLECLLQRAPATGAGAPALPAASSPARAPAQAPASPLAALSTHAAPFADHAPPSTGAGSRRRPLLLAEDNPVNVEVATAMLGGLGFDVHCAANGEEALREVRNGSFEVVLMDCQMPVMDGFKATAEIRRHEQQQGRPRKLPIIAITANAMQGDREACLAAGMDDYLSKPYSQQQLAAVIGRWIQLPVAATVHHADLIPATSRAPTVIPAQAGTQFASAADTDTAAHDTINVSALNNIRALSHDRGGALVRKVVTAYVDDTTRHLETLRSAITGRDALLLRKEAHSLKSSSANVGADTLAQMCKEMEHLGRTDTTEGAAGILTDMEVEFQAVRHTLTAILEKES